MLFNIFFIESKEKETPKMVSERKRELGDKRDLNGREKKRGNTHGKGSTKLLMNLLVN